MSITPLPGRKQIIRGFLPGLLLALIQLILVLVGASLGFPVWSNAYGFILSPVLGVSEGLYLVFPALLAFLVTQRTHQSSIGYHAGRLSGVTCAVLLLLVTVLVLASVLGSSEYRMGGAFAFAGAVVVFVLSLFINGLGILLARLGAFLGSRRGKSDLDPFS